MTACRRPADPTAWQGRVDAAEVGDARRWHQVVRPWHAGVPAGTALLGFACDAGVRRNQGRPGAADGPGALRRALAGLAWHASAPAWDAGDVVVGADALELGQRLLGEAAAELLGAGQRVIVLGGGHEVAYGSHLGLAAALDGTVGIINLDAHFDLRAGPASSGTPFREIAEQCAAAGREFRYLALGINRDANTAALFDTARRLGARWILDEAIAGWRLAEVRAELAAFIAGVDHLHLSIDLDALPAAAVPGVSAPAARGVAPDLAELLIADVAASGRLRLADIAELSPALDIDGRSARVAARLAARLAVGYPAADGGLTA